MANDSKQPKPSKAVAAPERDAITGIEAFQGKGIREAKGFWEDAWSQVLRRPLAVFGLSWIVIIAFFAVFAPLIASGHPLLMWELDNAGNRSNLSSPLLANLRTSDWLLIVGTIAGIAFWFAPIAMKKSQRLVLMVLAALQMGFISIGTAMLRAAFTQRDVSDFVRQWETARLDVPLLGTQDVLAWSAVLMVGIPISAIFVFASPLERLSKRALWAATIFVATAVMVIPTFRPGLTIFPYADREAAGEIAAVYTIIPWSPNQRIGDRRSQFLEPGDTTGTALVAQLTLRLPTEGPLPEDVLERIIRAGQSLPLDEADLQPFVESLRDFLNTDPTPTRAQLDEWARLQLQPFGKPYFMGTNSFGQDVMSQMIHAARLSISIGLVSTGIAVFIGIFMGAMMGYFGGWIDMVLYRITEIFMAIPVLFLLVVAAGVLPRNTFVMMAIIGCFTWHGAARFTRAEFYRLRNQDFVQSANAVGLPLRSILFKHMLPNGVTPVLVDASFAIAAAILFETILSFLGLGPEDQPSWGKLLSDATAEAGTFSWWLAIFPGFAIFLTVLAYNLIGEALRDAIDPKLKKARV